jgi:hypothetical protein
MMTTQIHKNFDLIHKNASFYGRSHSSEMTPHEKIKALGSTLLLKDKGHDPVETKRFAFLMNRLSNVTFSLGKTFVFTFEDFMGNTAVREKVFAKLQKVIIKKISHVSVEILKEMKKAKTHVTLKNAADLERWNFVLKVVKELNKIRNLQSEKLHDIQAIFSFSAKVSNAYDKWNKGEIHIDLKEFIENYASFDDLAEVSYDAFTSVKELVNILDNNSLTKMAYEAVGYGKEFILLPSELVETISSLHNYLIPLRLYLKSAAFFRSSRNWVYFDKSQFDDDNLIISKYDEVKKAIIKDSLDLSREGLKIGIDSLIFVGWASCVPYSVTVAIALLSISSLSIKVYNGYSKTKDFLPAPPSAA